MKRREFLKSLGALALTPLACLLGKKESVAKDKYGGHRGYVSWKTYNASVILNEDWLVRINIV